MPKISTYGTVTPAASDRIVVSDASDSNATKNITVGSLSSATAVSYYVDAYDIGPKTVTISETDGWVTIPNIVFNAEAGLNSGFDLSGQSVVKNGSGVGLTACKIIAILNVTAATGGADLDVEVRFIKNSTPITTSVGHTTVDNNHPDELTIATIQALAVNDTVGLQIKNVTSTTDLVIDHVNLIITSL